MFIFSCLGLLCAEIYKAHAINEYKNFAEKLTIDYDEEIYEEYGIKVYVYPDIDNFEFLDLDDYIVDKVLFDSHISLTKNAIYRCLSYYSDEAFKYIPKEWYITGDIYNYDNGQYNYIGGYTLTNNKTSYAIFINSDLLLYGQDIDWTIHHEIAHSLQNAITTKDYREFVDLDSSCHSISDYACTSVSEEISESWAYGLNYTDNIKANYLHEKYGHMLKG